MRWCHGTDLGIASSPDGRTWTYRGTAQGLEFEPGRNTFWAPCLVTHGGAYHMYVAYVRGVPADWSGDRRIVHYTSRDLVHWTFKSVLALSSNRVIDAFVYAKPSGGWRMWYKDETNGSDIYAADSEDLDRWTVKGPVVTAKGGQEGPAVFHWRGAYWLLVDRWQGMGVLRSDDLERWTEQPGTILGAPRDAARRRRHRPPRRGDRPGRRRLSLLFHPSLRPEGPHPAGQAPLLAPGRQARDRRRKARLRPEQAVRPRARPPSGYRPAMPPASPLALRTSDPKLAAAFAWAKAQALDYVFPATVNDDPVGDWYEAALPDRFAFCMRDVSHQAAGAQALGLAAFNLNMLRKFAAGLSASRQYCSYWEIDKWNRPAPVDYKNDRDFWYNLPANFDVLDACWRQFRWTGNSAYLEDPAFRDFYEQSVTSYIRAWDNDGDGVPDHRRSDGNRGLGSYDEGPLSDRTAIGADLLAAEFRAFQSYAAILRRRGERSRADGARSEGRGASGSLLRKMVEPKLRRFAGLMLEGGALNFDDLFWYGALSAVFRIPPAGARARCDPRPARRARAGGIEVESYLPEVFYRYGRDDAAYVEILKLSDPGKKRREYPEVPFALVGAIAAGTMGIDPDAAARTVATRSRLTAATAWAELAGVPVLGNVVDVRHDGRTRSTLTNVSGPALAWRAAFDGSWTALFVDGKKVEATHVSDEAGRPISWVTVTVPPGRPYPYRPRTLSQRAPLGFITDDGPEPDRGPQRPRKTATADP